MKKLKLRVKKKYANNFKRKYGDESLEMFETILWDTGSLTEVAKHFKFSRACASYFFHRIYDMPFKKYQELRTSELTKTNPQKIKSFKTLLDIQL